MEFRIAKAARNTGAMLERLVREALRTNNIAEPNCVVCYGVGYTGPLPSLNATCNANKMQQGVTLRQALGEESLEIIPITNAQQMRQNFPFYEGTGGVTDRRVQTTLPVVARKVAHSKGKDMRLCRTMAGVQTVLRNGRHDFFTPVVVSDTEYRAWVYRRRVLAVYEKRLTEPENNTRFGRNRANGWTFHALESAQIPDVVRRVAVAAVRALNLDFGAVDILGRHTPQGMAVTVLEVNSAPGVSDEHRTAIVKLVNRVKEWAAHGCPSRTASGTGSATQSI